MAEDKLDKLAERIISSLNTGNYEVLNLDEYGEGPGFDPTTGRRLPQTQALKVLENEQEILLEGQTLLKQ